MGWFSKEIKSNAVKEAREKLNQKLKLISEQYVDKIKIEDAPILPIIPIGECWAEVIPGINVQEPNFPYDKSTDTIFVINAKAGTKIGPHRHHESETIHVITGCYKDILKDRVYINGETILYNSLTPHGMEFLDNTILIAHWKKLK